MSKKTSSILSNFLRIIIFTAGFIIESDSFFKFSVLYFLYDISQSVAILQENLEEEE